MTESQHGMGVAENLPQFGADKNDNWKVLKLSNGIFTYLRGTLVNTLLLKLTVVTPAS